MTNPENQAFFDAAREGRFMLGRCKACSELHYYPRAVCPFCSGVGSPGTELEFAL